MTRLRKFDGTMMNSLPLGDLRDVGDRTKSSGIRIHKVRFLSGYLRRRFIALGVLGMKRRRSRERSVVRTVPSSYAKTEVTMAHFTFQQTQRTEPLRVSLVAAEELELAMCSQ